MSRAAGYGPRSHPNGNEENHVLLADKVAIVSGVGPGLGQANARALAREGARVVLAARRKQNLDATAQEIRDAGGEALVVPTNLVDADQVTNLVDTTMAEYGRLDILVNNAFRMGSLQPLQQTEVAHWRKVFEVNVFGAIDLTLRCVPHLKKAAVDHGDASIVFVSSLASRKSSPDVHEGDYAASKGAVNAMMRALAHELGPDGVRVNAVVPGWIGGPNVHVYLEWQAADRGISVDEVRAEIERRIPLRMIPPQDEIANSVVFFASPWSRVITGQMLDVNGGEWMSQ
jgi:NAD(P)-dependent dehydrogenase (short-subunit alcohol dehydrogenase family)